MPAESLAGTTLTIRPLTFAQILQSAGQWKPNRITAEPGGMPLQALSLPVAYHLATSAYGAYDGDEAVGWMFLRGWYQVLYIEALSVVPGPLAEAAQADLLAFAEAQARTLKRRWLALPARGENDHSLTVFEGLGFDRGHWRVLRRESPSHAAEPGQRVELRPLAGPAAEAAFREFALADVTASDVEIDEAFLARFLSDDPYRLGKRAWLARAGGEPVAYLSQAAQHLYVAARRPHWGSAAIRGAVEQAVAAHDAPHPIVVRLASGGHHDAAREVFEQIGFAEHPARLVRMIKHLDGSH